MKTWTKFFALACTLAALSAAEPAEQPPGFLLKWGAFGTADGAFRSPAGITVDASNVVYVADTQNNRVQKFTDEGAFVGKWGEFGTGNGQFDLSADVAVSSTGEIFVGDFTNQRIQVFDADLQYKRQIDVGCIRLALDPTGQYLYVPQGVTIAEYTNDGAFVRSWSGGGTVNSALSGIAVGASGSVYVTDRGDNVVRKFSSTGAIVTQWGGSGTGDGAFQGPIGVAVDAAEHVYVVDRSPKVQKFSSNGDFIVAWGALGSGDGEFLRTEDIAVDSNGNVYVTDSANNRVQKFGEIVTATRQESWGLLKSRYRSMTPPDVQLSSP